MRLTHRVRAAWDWVGRKLHLLSIRLWLWGDIVHDTADRWEPTWRETTKVMAMALALLITMYFLLMVMED